MHVFIDTNILLNFFHFSKDELAALNDVFASYENGAVKVYLTQQVCDEFKRNRENKIKDALKRFKDVRFSVPLPSFMKSYEEYNAINRLSTDLQKLVKEISEKVNADIVAKRLVADNLISDIFSKSEVLPVSSEIFSDATMRVRLGNPPGKNDSIGDAINWTILLNIVPEGEPLHVISGDGDFYSTLNEDMANPYLEEEWKEKKRSSLHVYRTLSAFMKEHFDGFTFPFDQEKEALIDDLFQSNNFANTHQIIAKLENFTYFSLKEVGRIMDAATENSQFGWIVTDYDISDFLNRIAVPRMESLTNPGHLEILKNVIEEQRERSSDS